MKAFHWIELTLFLSFGAVIFVGYALLFSPPGTLCPVDQSDCLRQWVGALSGWVAAFAAAAAIGPIVAQLREQRRQTDFIAGNAAPTVDIERRAHLSVRIRIVNWNRRMLVLDPVAFETSDGETLIANSILRRTDTLPNEVVVGIYGFKVLGWEDRTQRPPFYELAIELADPLDMRAAKKPLLVRLTGELIGESGGRFESTTVVRRWGTEPV